MSQIEEKEYYSRHLLLEDIGEDGQKKLNDSRVLVIGAGGLGCPCLQFLAASGVGHIGILDGDVVSVSNLHRQILYTIDDIDLPKAEIAAGRLSRSNPFISIQPVTDYLTTSNALDLISDYDIIVDCTDNFYSRYLINDASVILDKVCVYGAIHKYEGQVATFNVRIENEHTANYRDLYPTFPEESLIPSCNETGVLGVLPGLIGTYQALEVIKVITHLGTPLINKVLHIDTLANESFTVSIKPHPESRVSSLAEFEQRCGSTSMLETKEYDSAQDFLLDVRNKDEKPPIDSDGHIPLSELNSKTTSDLPRDKKLVVVCKSGKRSLEAVKLLRELEINNSYSLKGGIKQIR